MRLSDFVLQVDNFDALPPRELIKVFSWFLHTHRDKQQLDNEAIRGCFKEIHLNIPNVAMYVSRMNCLKPPELIKERNGFKLSRSVRTALDSKYGVHSSTIQVSKLLTDLPIQVPNLLERAFLVEAIKCYRVEAYRACIVMTWNLAFDHFLHWILSDPKRLSDFNSAIVRRFPKKTAFIICSQDQFEDLKESEVIEIALTASLASKNIIEILREKLKRRNIAAHPSQVIVTQSQADDVVTDLVNNVILTLT
jgi:hypothetical protein